MRSAAYTQPDNTDNHSNRDVRLVCAETPVKSARHADILPEVC